MSTRDASAAHHPADRTTARLTATVEPAVTAAGYDLEELVVRAAGQRSVVRVVVDRDAGVSLDGVAELSRAVSEVLDADGDDLGRPPYVLEVTSPGVDRPLTLPRHWRRNAGRLVTVAVGPERAREQLTGRLLRVTDDGIVLAVEKGGAKKGQVRRAVGERAVAWAELGEGRVQVEFTRPPGHRDAALVATAPEGDGADDEVDDDEVDDDEIDVDEIDDELDDLNDEHDPSGSGGAQ
ncbi:MAG TPA: ribosome maturation factor RimP [Modestobacter sp.]|nr:ribosome maturation factor RimP [Modestobacter sp.]